MKLSAWLTLGVVALAASPGHRVINKIKVGGNGGWDYVYIDSAAERLYASHTNVTEVIDLAAGKPVGQIADTQGVHGIAVASDLGRGFTSNGRANSVTIFDLKTLAKIGQVENTGKNPDAILYEPVTHKLFTFNGSSKDSTVIDAKAGTVLTTIAVGGKPEFSQADGKGKVYVNIEDTNEIVEIDAAKAAVTRKYALSGCEGPSGLAIDVKARRLFSVCGNRVMVISDPDKGAIVATLPIGAGSDGVAFDPGTGYAISANGDGTMTVVQQTGGKYDVVENIATERGARTIAVDEKTHRVYTPTATVGQAAAGGRAPYLPDSFKVLVVGK
jgi:DNA-binding beta-propeller fold protein YncE